MSFKTVSTSHSKWLTVGLLFFAFLIGSCSPSEPPPEPEELTLEYLMSLSDEELMERDSDGDGLSDYDEIYIYGTDPLNPDTDGDGLTDYEEIYVYGTDPLNPDTDGDGFSDGQEVEMGTDPLDPSDPPFIRKNELHTIYFEPNSYDISDEASELLLENVEKLNHAVEFSLQVNGNAPDEELALKRADAIVAFYLEQGISHERIISSGIEADADSCEENTNSSNCKKSQRGESVPINPHPFAPEF
ncbi:MAG: OmpA family protein [Balneolaceae bacterium]|nr:OmpA family protein [Balneolaceae bacterium]